MSDGDVQALVAYMNTLPAIRNPLPRTTLDFPVNYLFTNAPAPARKVAAVDANNKLEWGRYLGSPRPVAAIATRQWIKAIRSPASHTPAGSRSGSAR